MSEPRSVGVHIATLRAQRSEKRMREKHRENEGSFGAQNANSGKTKGKHMFHSMRADEVLVAEGSSNKGLTTEEAERRLAVSGKNRTDSAKKKSRIRLFFEQFADVMILILIAAAAISAAIAAIRGEYGELIDAGVILAIVLVDAAIGFVQADKAEAALVSLENMNKPDAKALRDGAPVMVKCEDIVPGDIIILEPGDVIPADLRLTETASLKIDESILTGESVPVEKHANAILARDAALGDRSNMAYAHGSVTYGRGRGVVVGTGMNTEAGKIVKLHLSEEKPAPPLKKQLDKTAKTLSIAVVTIAAIIFLIALLRHSSEIAEKSLDAFMTSVAIAVAAIPEGMPAVVTIVLALGVRKMSEKNAIVKNLPAVETLGCCEIICADKTGTVTMNEMTVTKIYTATGKTQDAIGFAPGPETELLARTLALCNDAQADGTMGDPTETALVSFFASANAGASCEALREEWRRTDEIPFDSVRKMMVTLNERDGARVIYAKGAPDSLLRRCSKIFVEGEIRDISLKDLEEIGEANRRMTEESALRVLCAAVDLEPGEKISDEGLTFVGLAGMIDPPRKEVKAAVRRCVEAGMRPIMITGDHVGTARAIAKEVGILRDGDEVMDGKTIDALSDEDFRERMRKVSVFARVSPENKVRIVNAYKGFGNVVAMTGDGVNDSPAIKVADIGIGMGRNGTDICRETADIVLADDNFATIVSAVEEGRKIYANIAKTVQFLLSANTAEVLCLFIASALLDVRLLTPVMILWVNLVTDGLPALSLGMEKAEADVMAVPPRRSHSGLFRDKMGADIIAQGVIQTALVMLSFCIGNYALADGVANHAAAMTMAFVSLCVIQLFHAYNMKDQDGSVLNKRLFDNKWLNLSFLAGVLLLCATVLIPPLRPVFGTAELNAAEWLISAGCGLAVIPCAEAHKAISRAARARAGKKRV